MRFNQPTRATMVTDRSTPLACVSTNIPRALYDEFERRAHAKGVSKAGLMRDLIETFLATREPS